MGLRRRAPQYTIGLLHRRKSQSADHLIALRGPFESRKLTLALDGDPACFQRSANSHVVSEGAVSASPRCVSAVVFLKLASPTLDSSAELASRPVQGDSTPRPDSSGLARTESGWPMAGVPGARLTSGSHEPGSASADRRETIRRALLCEKRSGNGGADRVLLSFRRDGRTILRRSHAQARGLHSATWHATDSTDVRMRRSSHRCVVLTHQAPYLRATRGRAGRSLPLGVLCSIPLDWYARRFVETSPELPRARSRSRFPTAPGRQIFGGDASR